MRRTSSLPRMTRRRADSSSAARRAVADRVSGGIRLDSTMWLGRIGVTGVINEFSVPSSQFPEKTEGQFPGSQQNRAVCAVAGNGATASEISQSGLEELW